MSSDLLFALASPAHDDHRQQDDRQDPADNSYNRALIHASSASMVVYTSFGRKAAGLCGSAPGIW